ncbi:MAG: hypothetical protein IPP29_15665 [Bacteroidetes bacterium]|nr:hypothetical protein [Bacteroidota bacterium]
MAIVCGIPSVLYLSVWQRKSIDAQPINQQHQLTKVIRDVTICFLVIVKM